MFPTATFQGQRERGCHRERRKKLKIYGLRVLKSPVCSAGSWPNDNPGLGCMWLEWESDRVRGSTGFKVIYCGVEKATEGDLLNFLRLVTILRRAYGSQCQCLETR